MAVKTVTILTRSDLWRVINFLSYLSLVTRKPVFGGFHQVPDSNRPAQLQRQGTLKNLGILDLANLSIILHVYKHADLRLCCSHMTKADFVMTWLTLWLPYNSFDQIFQQRIEQVENEGIYGDTCKCCNVLSAFLFYKKMSIIYRWDQNQMFYLPSDLDVAYHGLISIYKQSIFALCS